MDPLSHATEYTLTPAGTDLDTAGVAPFIVRVHRRGPDQWALLNGGKIWNGHAWEDDRPAISQDAQFLSRCLRGLKDALEAGAGLPDAVLVAGKTWSQWQGSGYPTPSLGQPRERPAATIYDLAAAILSRTGQITTMKLHRLAYYCQAWHLVWEDRLLVDAAFHAWAMGPVSPELHASHAGEFLISTISGDPDRFSADENDSIDEVIDAYGPLSNLDLGALVKSEDPWRAAWSGTEPGKRGRLIEVDRMQSFYLELDGEPMREAAPSGPVGKP